MPGWASQACFVLASRPADRVASCCSLARSMPEELVRLPKTSVAYRSTGSGMRSCGAPTGEMEAASSIGLVISWSIGSDGSLTRLTKEVLAPFSSRRRTR